MKVVDSTKKASWSVQFLSIFHVTVSIQALPLFLTLSGGVHEMGSVDSFKVSKPVDLGLRMLEYTHSFFFVKSQLESIKS